MPLYILCGKSAGVSYECLSSMEKVEFSFEFKNEHGLHARPAGELVKEVKENLTSDVTIAVPSLNKTAKADKLFTLMGLGVKKGENVKVTVEGEHAASDAEKLKVFLNEKFAPESEAPVKITDEDENVAGVQKSSMGGNVELL